MISRERLPGHSDKSGKYRKSKEPDPGANLKTQVSSKQLSINKAPATAERWDTAMPIVFWLVLNLLNVDVFNWVGSLNKLLIESLEGSPVKDNNLLDSSLIKSPN